MKYTKRPGISKSLLLSLLFGAAITTSTQAELDAETARMVDEFKQGKTLNYHRARWAPIHFPPAIEKADNDDCLNCHQEVLDDKPRELSPAGVKASDTLAWYQTLDTYIGEQDTFHRRHLAGPLAGKLMDMKCTTCHQSNDPREETAGSSANSPANPTQRKAVDPDICLMCHGKFPWQVMAGLTGPWSESGKVFANNCMACHAVFRTERHKVNYLKPEAIEAAGLDNGNSCYGCHGGRAWYRISYPYPRHPWPTMAKEVPDWAKGRPTESDSRFLIKSQ